MLRVFQRFVPVARGLRQHGRAIDIANDSESMPATLINAVAVPRPNAPETDLMNQNRAIPNGRGTSTDTIRRYNVGAPNWKNSR